MEQPMTVPTNYPYKEEAQLFIKMAQIFFVRLPQVIGNAAECLTKAALSTEIFKKLSIRSNEELRKLGIARSELPRVAAATSGLFLSRDGSSI